MLGRTSPAVAVLATIAGLAVTAATASAQALQTASFGDVPGALRLPEAVAFAPNGDLLVGDHFSGRVQRFRDGKYLSSFGLHGEGCGRLGAIGGVAADAQGNTYVLDTDQQLVQVFDASGASVRCFGGRGNGPGRLRTTSGAYAASSASGGIAVTKSYVYVADAGNDRVQRFTLTGKDPKILGKGKLKTPQGLAVKGSRLLVADDANHRVVELTISGRFVKATTTTTVKLRFPYDVVLDAKGKAYVADNNLHRIVVLDRHLKRVRAFGGEGRGQGRFVFPRAVAIDPRSHNLVVADAGNDRIQELTPTGRFVRTIGINGRAAPRITQPADVAANAFGEVAVADGNGRISWFDLQGAFTGAWAQSRSFQQSTAVVSKPSGIDFGTDRSVRVVDGGEVRAFADASVTTLLGGGPKSPSSASSVDVAADGAVWAAQGTGQFLRVPDHPTTTRPQLLGRRGEQSRTTTAIAGLSDGTLAVAEGTSPHQTNPPDGTVAHYDSAGRLLATWKIPRPAGGQPSRPGGLAATADGGVWVSDTANDVLLRLAPDGTIAQRLGAPGTGDGQLADPRGLEVDCAGGLLVADAGNNRIVRFADVALPVKGCAAAGTRTADGRPPGPVGLKLKTKHHASAPARELGTITATCTRTCDLETIDATIGTASRGRIKTYPLKVAIRGRTLTLSASASTVAAMRAVIAKRSGTATAGVVVTGTARDGVVDTASIVWTFR